MQTIQKTTPIGTPLRYVALTAPLSVLYWVALGVAQTSIWQLAITTWLAIILIKKPCSKLRLWFYAQSHKVLDLPMISP